MPTRIADIYRDNRFGLSIEIFPPKTPQGDAALFETLDRLTRYRPAFVSCTYGAGGSTRERTVALCADIQQRYGVTATAHRTCVGSTREELIEWLQNAVEKGILNFMALRGDPPQGEETFRPVAGGLQHADELVTLIRQHFPQVGIGVAGYPETHQEAPDWQTDLQHLKHKVDCGADAVFTQLFFINEHFFRFRDRCEAVGISVPLIPGIMPLTSYNRIKRITAMCGAVFPEELAEKLQAVQDDEESQFHIGTEHAIAQCRELMAAGVPGLHFYALNKSTACERILEALGFEATSAESSECR